MATRRAGGRVDDAGGPTEIEGHKFEIAGHTNIESMNATVIKKVRLTPAEAAALRRAAAKMKITESDVIREGLRRIGILLARQENMQGLIDLASVGNPDKESWKARL